MEEHPEHWRHTLMGRDFWQDAKQYENKISQELDIGKVDHLYGFDPSHKSGHFLSGAYH
jgi:hypothetical protein